MNTNELLIQRVAQNIHESIKGVKDINLTTKDEYLLAKKLCGEHFIPHFTKKQIIELVRKNRVTQSQIK
ncbi:MULTISPECIES: hypothetical protein [unclassified Acinetobacter]|uniref:hypothetical protein n=1 Tax=unclassified Acinetobacter TaxID=196816 RepID=UPI0025755232|nr:MULTISPECIES: hypothetical protein [unclassified Acinetobacter]MDM1766069.1 hypothetical protein [Acinetobacter sp. 226-1]MDM1769819.1 hypothetical protein [Acinetobacter sp. 226-4]